MSQNIFVGSFGSLTFHKKEYHCALGENGLTSEKKEGDGATPSGCFLMRRVWYRADRIEKPETVLETRMLKETDGWCDDPNDKNYNRHVTLPYTGSHESLWREDHVYDIVVELGYNDDPVVPGNGSAIFMHIVREDHSPTAGCIALKKEDLLEILGKIDAGTRVCVSSEK